MPRRSTPAAICTLPLRGCATSSAPVTPASSTPSAPSTSTSSGSPRCTGTTCAPSQLARRSGPVPVEKARDLFHEHLGIERLSDPRARAHLGGSSLRIVGGGDDHDRRGLRFPLAVLLGELLAAHHRHLHVEDDEIGSRALHRLE